MTLADLLTLNAFHLILVFARMGGLFMLMPGVAATYVPARIRLILSLACTLILLPVVQPLLPQVPEAPAALILLVMTEVFYGVFLGLVGQFALAALHLAGSVLGREMSLMNAMVFDPVTEQQGALVIGMLSNIAVLLIFVADIHHVMLTALAASYTLFEPGEAPIVGDHLMLLVSLLGRAFVVGTQISAPAVVISIIFYVAMGIIVRLAPQLNIFFISLPLKIMLGLALLWIMLPGMMFLFLDFFEGAFRDFIPF